MIAIWVCENIPAFSNFCAHCNSYTFTPSPSCTLYFVMESINSWVDLAREIWAEVIRVLLEKSLRSHGGIFHVSFFSFLFLFLFFFCPGGHGSSEARLVKCYNEYSLPYPQQTTVNMYREWGTDASVCVCVWNYLDFGMSRWPRLPYLAFLLILCSIRCDLISPCLYSVSLHLYYA